MRFFYFHLMPYADVDLDAVKAVGTSWVKLPNSNYDPKKGAALYNRYLDEMERAEELGFDGLGVNEHHQTAYGMMPSPIVTASAQREMILPSLIPIVVPIVVGLISGQFIRRLRHIQQSLSHREQDRRRFLFLVGVRRGGFVGVRLIRQRVGLCRCV